MTLIIFIKNFIYSLLQNDYFTSATSLDGVESLVEHRKSVGGENSTTPANLLRISVGIEHIDDLIADWEQALTNLM